MTNATTVVFADLTGSTGVFEALGNDLAAQAITALTQWIGEVCEFHGGRVVKSLGDGVLAMFPHGACAVDATVELQRVHTERLPNWPNNLRMRLQIGMAAGEIIEQDGDCFGDAVNVASRLSDLSGPDQIWATGSVTEQIESPNDGVRFRSLGPVPIRGKSEELEVFSVEWHADARTVNFTQPAPLPVRKPATAGASGLELAWLDQKKTFSPDQMPIHLGRVDEAEFVVNDQRVSRLHARLSWRNGTFVLEDLSSYGTWVRFNGSPNELALRRIECALPTNGEIALGAAFDDFTVPTVTFRLLDGTT